MPQLYVSAVTGTAATILAIILVLLRAKFQGRRPVVGLIRRWVATGTGTSGLVLALLAAIGVYSFTRIPANEWSEPGSASPLGVFVGAPSVQGTAFLADGSSRDAQAMEALRAYAGNIDAQRQSISTSPTAPEAVALFDVDTMIAKLVARLERQADDVKGWKTLGWSYLNTGRPEEAATAFETALKLQPSDSEIKKGLEEARSGQTLTIRTPPSDPATSPAAGDFKAAEGGSDTQHNSMIRGMVDQLATRLETSPNDEDGWLLLMRSHMTLGKKDAAKAALTKALGTFASDAVVKTRLTAAARELGVESN